MIANPEKCSSAFIVDSLYWSKNIVANYLSEIKDISNNVAERAQGETNNIFDNLQNTDNVQQNIEDIDKENLKNDDANQIFEEIQNIVLLVCKQIFCNIFEFQWIFVVILIHTKNDNSWQNLMNKL